MWQRFHEKGCCSLHLSAAVMSRFHSHEQRELLDPWVRESFEPVPTVFEERVLGRSRALLEELGERQSLHAPALREANHDPERALRCCAFATS